MKKLLLFITTIILSFSVNAQEHCISCPGNTINYNNYASAAGTGNYAWGFCSLAAGEANRLTGEYSVAMGKENTSNGIASFALGEKCNAKANYSVAMGYKSVAQGLTSFCMGNNAFAGGESSAALGFFVKATPDLSFVIGQFIHAMASETITLGSGTFHSGEIKYLSNNVYGTMMIGFNSDLPTFFVSRSSGFGTTGKIGVGNVTEPSAKLHIRADATENASLFLQPSDWDSKYALVKLGTSGHYLKADKNDGMTFKSEKDFLFTWDESGDGNVGIGIDDPGEKLQVAGNILAEKFYGDGSDLEGVNDNLGNHVATDNIQLAGNFLSGDGNNEGIFISDYGRVGINTDEPAAKLHIASAEDSRIRLEYKDVAPVESAISKFWDIHNAAGKLKFHYGSGSGEPSNLNLLVIDEDGNVGVGMDIPDEKLHVAGNIMAAKYYGDGSELEGIDDNLGDHVATENIQLAGNFLTGDGDDEGIFINNLGDVGIGTDIPAEKLDVAGDVKVNGTINFTGQLLHDDQPFETSKWEDASGDNIYYTSGNVGIGTDDPDANLHIKEPLTNETKTFLKVESENDPGGGSTEIGRLYGNGPVFIQKAADVGNFSNGHGPKLWIQQKTHNNEIGLSLATWTKQGVVEYVDIFAYNGPFYLRSMEGLHVKTGGNNPIKFYTKGVEGKETGILQMEINAEGQVGIGTTTHSDPDTRLTVAGRIHAQEVKVTAGAGTGADFVFEEDYDLPEISDVETFIRANRHLPDIPSARQMQEEGLDIGQMQIKLLQKIEELTLYVIDLKKENDEMREENEKLKRR